MSFANKLNPQREGEGSFLFIPVEASFIFATFISLGFYFFEEERLDVSEKDPNDIEEETDDLPSPSMKKNMKIDQKVRQSSSLTQQRFLYVFYFIFLYFSILNRKMNIIGE
jgi:hypothetical protein